MHFQFLLLLTVFSFNLIFMRIGTAALVLSRELTPDATAAESKPVGPINFADMTLSEYSVTILAFGDSLTQGLVVSTKSWHPYTRELQKLIGSTGAIVENKGLSGEKTNEMVQRLESVLHKLRSSHRNPSVAIILGGTNDLGSHQPADVIFKNLEKLHVMCHRLNSVEKKKTYTIAVTIPECAWPIDQDARKTVNRLLKQYAANSNYTYLFDLDAIMPQSASNAHWDVDKVHLTDLGYAYFGQKLYEFLKSNKIK